MHIINNQFTYPKLNRQDGAQRVYGCPDGSKVPSVTTILDKTSDKTHLERWRKRVGYDKAKQITTEAANVGTGMHKFLEHHLLHTPKSPGSNMGQQMGHKMAQVIIDDLNANLQEIWGNEVNLFYPQLYAGTTDAVGVYNNKETIIDFKQSNKFKKREWIENYFLQTSAYALAHNEILGTSISNAVILICVRADPTNPQLQKFEISGDELKKYAGQWWDRVESYYANYHSWS